MKNAGRRGEERERERQRRDRKREKKEKTMELHRAGPEREENERTGDHAASERERRTAQDLTVPVSFP